MAKPKNPDLAREVCLVLAAKTRDSTLQFVEDAFRVDDTLRTIDHVRISPGVWLLWTDLAIDDIAARLDRLPCWPEDRYVVSAGVYYPGGWRTSEDDRAVETFHALVTRRIGERA